MMVKPPLFYACYCGNDVIVRYLVEHGANVNKKDHDVLKPIFYAIRNGFKSIINYLWNIEQRRLI